MLSDAELCREMERLGSAARRAVLETPAFASDAALLFAEAAEELGAALQLEQQHQAAAAVLGIARQLRALAPMLAGR